MKSSRIFSVLCPGVLLFAIAVHSQEIRVDNESIVFLYEARAEFPAPDQVLSEIISADYRNARDEFTRYDLMQEISPAIERRIAEAADTNAVLLLVGGQLEDYNFE